MKVGDRVYCIDNEGRNSLVKGEFYTVSFIYELSNCLELYDFGGRSYAIERFVTESGLRKLKLEKIEKISNG